MSKLVASVGSKLWQSYNHSLATNPLVTKCFTSFSGFIIGDSIAQLATSPVSQFDFKRTAKFAAFGFVVHAPGCHYFYKALDLMVFPASPKSPKAIVSKILVDQLMFTPLSICVFYSAFKTMEGRMDQIRQTIKEKFWATLFAGYTVWPLAHFINFRFISNQHRVLYINVVSVGWNVILCKIATSSDQGALKEAKLKKTASSSTLQQLEAGIMNDRKGIVEIASSRR